MFLLLYHAMTMTFIPEDIPRREEAVEVAKGNCEEKEKCRKKAANKTHTRGIKLMGEKIISQSFFLLSLLYFAVPVASSNHNIHNTEEIPLFVLLTNVAQ